jgi:hypothetical protein
LKFQKEQEDPPQSQNLRNKKKNPHIFVGTAESWDWSHYENRQMVFLTKSNFYVKNFSFLIIFLSKRLYKGYKFNEKYRKNLHSRGPTPRLIPGLTGIASKNPALLNEC